MREDLADASERNNSESITSRAYLAIRNDIVRGILVPGSKLKIESLRERYGMGASPIREALSLLTSTSLVERLDQRGFRVAPISLADFEQLLWTRCKLEAIALRESMIRGGRQWEEKVVIANYRLSRALPRIGENRQETNPEWEELHKVFHMALLSDCGSDYLIAICSELFDQNVRYRLTSRSKQQSERDVKEEHSAISDAILDRDCDRAVTLLEKHYCDTGEFLRKSLNETM